MSDDDKGLGADTPIVDDAQKRLAILDQAFENADEEDVDQLKALWVEKAELANQLGLVKPPPTEDELLKRPGVSVATLKRYGIRWVDLEEARTFGMMGAGALLPYFKGGDCPPPESSPFVNTDGTPVLSPGVAVYRNPLPDKTGKGFCRLRLADEMAKACGRRYTQPAASGSQLYLPPHEIKDAKTLVITEGEFKSLALVEAGIPAAAIGGIQSCSGAALEMLREHIDLKRIETVAFLGDADTCLIYDFSRAAVKLRGELPEGVRLVLPRANFSGPKGIDDLREADPEGFPATWDRMMIEAVEVTSSTTSDALALLLLAPAMPAIKEQFPTYEEKFYKFGSRLEPVARKQFITTANQYLDLGVLPLKQQIKIAEQKRKHELSLLGYNKGGIDLSDSLLTDRFADSLRDTLCFSAGSGWRRWNGKTWKDAHASEVLLIVSGEVEKLIADHRDTISPRDYGWLRSLKKIEATAKLLQGHLCVDDWKFDNHPELLGAKNGVVNLRTGALTPHDPKLLMTRSTAAEYRPGATHPDWTAALLAVDDEVRDLLQVRFGQAITGEATPDDVLPIMQGAGSNGKSSIIAALSRTLTPLGFPGYFSILPWRLMSAGPDAHPTEMTLLQGARLVVIEEASDDRRLNVKRLKDVLGTPTISARKCGKDSVEWRATHSLFITSNHKLRVDEGDHGTWRRLAVVPFPYTFVDPSDPLDHPHERHGDNGLRERLLKGEDGQWEAVLAWLVAGAQRFLAEGFPALPAQVRAATAEWRGESDKVLKYVSEWLEFDPESWVLCSDLFAHFNEQQTRDECKRWGAQLWTNSFGSHASVTKHGVMRNRRKAKKTGLSRAPGSMEKAPAEGATVRVWEGVRFRSNG